MSTEEVIKKYFSEPIGISFEEFGAGATNLTYKVTIEVSGENKSYILQKMSAVFDVSMMEDIDAITKHLASKNILTQSVVKTLDGDLFVKDDESWWRMLTFIPGRIFPAITSPNQAEEAGRLVGLFHTALLDLSCDFKYKISHFHDISFIMENLKNTLTKNENTEKYLQLKSLAQEILSNYQKLPKSDVLPKRIIHGDLKITNVIFSENGETALALADLDTFMRGTVAIELGDALRSWCVPGGEDTDTVEFDKNIYDKALEGYFSTATFLTPLEKNSIPLGVELITLELSARFVIDAFNEKYWVLDSSKYKTLHEQNKKRAENQLAFYKEFKKEF